MRFLVWLAVALIGVVMPLVFFALVFYAQPARAHDIYKELPQPGNPSLKCCGGEGPNADCEALDHSQITQRGGSFVIDSKRWGRPVLLSEGRIVFSGVPGEKPGTAGHWCGRPRTYDGQETTEDQPDPGVWTYCAYINPGGV